MYERKPESRVGGYPTARDRSHRASGEQSSQHRVARDGGGCAVRGRGIQPTGFRHIPAVDQSSLAAPRGLTYAVDIVFCIDATGSMTPIIDQVKANALRFYDDVQSNLTAKGKNVDQLRVRVIGFRDFAADGAAALDESPFFTLPDEQADFSAFVNGLVAEGGGDAPESGLEAVALAIDSPGPRPAIAVGR